MTSSISGHLGIIGMSLNLFNASFALSLTSGVLVSTTIPSVAFVEQLSEYCEPLIFTTQSPHFPAGGISG